MSRLIGSPSETHKSIGDDKRTRIAVTRIDIDVATFLDNNTCKKQGPRGIRESHT
jgi:hypothetical protein